MQRRKAVYSGEHLRIIVRSNGVAVAEVERKDVRAVGEAFGRVIALVEPGKVHSSAGPGVRQDSRDFVGAVVLRSGRINGRQVTEDYRVVHRTDRWCLAPAGVGISSDEECLGVETDEVLSFRHHGIEVPNRMAVRVEIVELLIS